VSRAFVIRRWATWLFFAASLISLVAAGKTASMAIAYFGLDYPRSLTPRLPIATQQLLQHSWLYTAWTTPGAVVAILCAYLIMRRARSQEAAYHYLSLLTLAIYHLAFMAIVFFTLLFFLLPRAFVHTQP
jgi:hypothetical protein